MVSPETHPAATALARTPELLRSVATQTRNRKLFYNLCLVNRAFHTAFTPFLYREIDIYNRHGQFLRSFAINPHIHHTWKLSCHQELGPNVHNGVTDEEFNTGAQAMLRLMPLLTTFEWFECPLATATIAILKSSCPKVKSLAISYPDMEASYLHIGPFAAAEVNPEEDNAYRVQDFTGFTNLKELSLSGLHNDLSLWTSHLVTILRLSPELERLRLSIAKDAITRLYYADETSIFFLETLCNDYQATGADPLRLRSLYLGTSVFVWDGDCLSKLTDPTFLEEVHIENLGVWNEIDCILMYDNDEESGLDFNMFTPDRYPNLHRFSASQYKKDVQNWLCAQGPDFTRQLALTFETQEILNVTDLLQEDEEYENLPLPLRMLTLDVYEDEEREDSLDTVLLNLVSVCSDSLEGLDIKLPVTQPEEQEDAENKLLESLTDLSALRQLAVNPQLTLSEVRQFATDMTTFSAENLEETACRLGNAAPSLRYIRICWLAWHISRDQEGRVLKLDELDSREQSDVELFRIINMD